MLYGDLSTELAPSIGFRFERVIKNDKGRLNKGAKAYLERVAALNVLVIVITTGDARRAMAFMVKWGVPYTRVLAADSFFEVADLVRENDMMTYYDTDRDVLNNVNSRGGGKVEVKQWTFQED